MDAKNILSFIHKAESLKRVLRHSWLSDGRQESAAEHSWRVSLMVLLSAPSLEGKVDLLKSLKIAVIHDIVECYAGDIPAFDKEARKENKKKEIDAINKIKEDFDDPITDEIVGLWKEFEERRTPEARFVVAIDKLEMRIQHNEADIDTWKDIEFSRSLSSSDRYCSHDSFLKKLNGLIVDESRKKIIDESDKDIENV